MAYKTRLTSSSASHNIKKLPLDELIKQYGIEIDPIDESIWDMVEGKRFKNLKEWALHVDEMSNDDLYDNYARIGSKQAFDDGF